MKNYTIIYGLSDWKKKGKDGVPVPEIYHLSMEDGQLIITFTELGWIQANTFLNNSNNLLQETSFIPPSEPVWGCGGVFHTTKINTEYRVSIPDTKNKKKQNLISKSMTVFTTMEMLMIDGVHGSSSLDNPQLFSLNTIYRPSEYAGASLSLTISPYVVEVLKTLPENSHLPGVRAFMKDHIVALDGKRNARLFEEDIQAFIRTDCTLRFVTAGNCACMGQMPEEVKSNVGLYIDSHNVDSPQQQINLIVGIAALWQWVREQRMEG